MKHIYLACPFSNPDPAIREYRYQEACKKAGQLIKQGYIVFSPLSHSVPISRHLDNENDSTFWVEQDLSFIQSWATEMWILTLKDWQLSQGIHNEIWAALKVGLPINFCEPVEDEE